MDQDYKVLEIDKRKKAIDDNNNHRIDEFTKTINDLKIKREQLSEKTLAEIITRDNIVHIFHTTDTNELGEEINFNNVKSNEYFDLLKFLLRNGYIDETYNDYMSFFYDNSMTMNDKMFLRSITDKRAKKYDYSIDNIDLVFLNLTPVDFSQEETKNFHLFKEILNNKERSSYLDKFMSQLKTSDCFDFLYQYLEIGQNTDVYIRELANRWIEFASVILENQKYTEDQIQKFCVCFVKFLSTDILTEINLDKCLSNYISNNEGFLEIENPDIEKIVNNFETLEIKFISIDIVKSDKELLKQVYIHDMYVLNMKNIKMWLHLYYNIDLSPELERKTLSIILSKDEESLSCYVKENLGEYLDVIAAQNILNTDDESIVFYVLNEDVEIEAKKKYVERLTYQLSELDKIDSVEMRAEVVKMNKVTFSLNNLLSYFRDNGLDSALIEFINESELSLACYESESAILDNFRKEVLSCNDLSDTKYLEILDAIGYEGDLFTETELSVYKVESMIERRWILMNKENLIFIRQTYPGVIIKYAQTDVEKYIELSKNGLAEVNEISEMLEVPIEDQEKVRLLETIPGEPVSVEDRDISLQLFKYIIENNYDSSDSPALFEKYSRYDDEIKSSIFEIAVSDFTVIKNEYGKADIELIDLILRSDEISIAERKELMLLVMDRISQQKCKEYLIVLECAEIAKLFDPNRRPKIEITTDNRKILECMKNNHFLKDYCEDDERNIFKVTRG